MEYVLLVPNLIGLALPLLLLLICPISMLLIIWGMQRGSCAAHVAPASHSQPARAQLSRDEQLTALKLQLAEVQMQHELIGRQIAELDAAPRMAVTGGSEAAVQIP